MIKDRRDRRQAPFMIPATGMFISLLAGMILVMAGFGNRIGAWDFRTGFDMLKIGAYGGLAGFVISLGGAVFAGKRRVLSGIAVALLGVVIGGMVFAIPLSWKIKASRVPPIHDITTDIVNPPGFVAILPLRKDAPNPAEYGGPEVAIMQRSAYPDIQPLVINLPAPQALEQALATARSMGWRIVAQLPEEGRIEATATTFWFGFKDDVVVRITPIDKNRSLVDIRSVSRVGRGDVGVNARRIRTFLQRIQAGK